MISPFLAPVGCMFVTDLHGKVDRYEKLIERVEQERPRALFMGGDLLPPARSAPGEFLRDFLIARFTALRGRLGADAPEIFVIMGNDDVRAEEPAIEAAAQSGLWHYVHDRRAPLAGYAVYGYACVPPTPFSLKDWERYDVGRHIDPGCVSPEEGRLSVPVDPRVRKHSTIARELEKLAGKDDLERAVFLFHTPPYQTSLDRIDPRCPLIDHAPADVNVGSAAVRKFIEARAPLLTLHGHIHESTICTGSWRDRIGRTHCFNAAHGGPELSLVRFDLADLDAATRELL